MTALLRSLICRVIGNLAASTLRATMAGPRRQRCVKNVSPQRPLSACCSAGVFLFRRCVKFGRFFRSSRGAYHSYQFTRNSDLGYSCFTVLSRFPASSRNGSIHQKVRLAHVHHCACMHDCTVCTESQPVHANRHLKTFKAC